MVHPVKECIGDMYGGYGRNDPGSPVVLAGGVCCVPRYAYSALTFQTPNSQCRPMIHGPSLLREHQKVHDPRILDCVSRYVAAILPNGVAEICLAYFVDPPASSMLGNVWLVSLRPEDAQATAYIYSKHAYSGQGHEPLHCRFQYRDDMDATKFAEISKTLRPGSASIPLRFGDQECRFDSSKVVAGQWQSISIDTSYRLREQDAWSAWRRMVFVCVRLDVLSEEQLKEIVRHALLGSCHRYPYMNARLLASLPQKKGREWIETPIGAPGIRAELDRDNATCMLRLPNAPTIELSDSSGYVFGKNGIKNLDEENVLAYDGSVSKNILINFLYPNRELGMFYWTGARLEEHYKKERMPRLTEALAPYLLPPGLISLCFAYWTVPQPRFFPCLPLSTASLAKNDGSPQDQSTQCEHNILFVQAPKGMKFEISGTWNAFLRYPRNTSSTQKKGRRPISRVHSLWEGGQLTKRTHKLRFSPLSQHRSVSFITIARKDQAGNQSALTIIRAELQPSEEAKMDACDEALRLLHSTAPKGVSLKPSEEEQTNDWDEVVSEVPGLFHSRVI